MKAKTTINFTDAQISALRSLMCSIGWQTPVEGSRTKIEIWRSDSDQDIARALSNLLDKADTLAVVTEGDIRK